MTIKCDVILDPLEANRWLNAHGLPLAHPMRTATPAPVPAEVPLIEQNDVTVALLGRNGHGAANVILVHAEARGFRTLTVPLALLEHIAAAMRAQVGPDPRFSAVDTEAVG